MNFNRYENIPADNSWPGRVILRKMGYLSDQQGIINRYLREQEGWNEHLQNTRRFVLKCIREANPTSISVLGSGWLLDFPLEEAYSVCRNITLTDIEHPPQIIRKTRDFPGVSLQLADITGGMIKEVFEFVNNARKNHSTLPLCTLAHCLPEKKTGAYYISLNILNQLDILLVDYIKKHLQPFEQEIMGLRLLQQSHVELVQTGGCLVTDVEEQRESLKGEIIGTKKLLFTALPTAKMKHEWTWDFDTSGSYNPGSITRMKVVALSC